MAKLYSSKYIIDVLKKHGFREVSQKGSHVKFRKNTHTVIIPHPRSEIPIGTFKSIMRQSGLDSTDF